MREMRRQDRKLTDTDIIEVIRKGEYGVLATVTSEGEPYSVPMSYAYDQENNAIYMHCTAEGGQKIDNILKNPKACFTVVAQTELLPESFATRYWSANAFGTVELKENAEDKKYGLYLLLKKYSADFEEKGLKYIDSAMDKVSVLKLAVSEMTGKARKK